MNRWRVIASVSALLMAACVVRGQAVPSDLGQSSAKLPAQLKNVGFDPQLNAQIPLDLQFVDENGAQVQLRDYFRQKPVVLAFVYYGCPMLCNQVQQGVVGALKMLSFTPGRDYEVVFGEFRSARIAGHGGAEKEERVVAFRAPGDGRRVALPYRHERKH